ncbi:hypothetical protein LZ017_08000 [Pelomonas sp. CA6]|uniref:DUF7151 family protein n=1 Tax=Pelomonas sp. CA6 TaxID=2907999 RepID=UPI001F4C060D|nr:hypothetical protein [Pelomonas sp. CA6]MCH7343321.1 hypothetical protein [Pelomonas sp. CA6]
MKEYKRTTGVKKPSTMERRLGQGALAMALGALLAACGDGGGTPEPQNAPGTPLALSPLVNLQPEAAGARCALGGTRIESGADLNQNGVLDSAEIRNTQYVCRSDTAARPTLVALAIEPAGARCAQGGTRVQAGLDANGNGVLDGAEISAVSHVCEAKPAAARPARLMALQAEPASTYCAQGGSKVSTGEDRNGDGRLDASEIAATHYLCSVTGPAGAASLVHVVAEPAGERCVAGGSKITAGEDRNRNQVLDSDEIAAVQYVCSGTAGPTGPTGAPGLSTRILQTTEPPGSHCPAGGQRISAGPDRNGNGMLDGDEIESTGYVCNGTNGSNGSNGSPGESGLNSLFALVVEPAGTNCAVGGNKVTLGLDRNRNQVLDADEVSATRYLCNGAPGGNGLASLVDVQAEPAGPHCSAGGSKISAGVDANRDGVLSASEVANVQYACNGTAGPTGPTGPTGPSGLNTRMLMMAEPPGANCATGGQRVSVGLDSNANGVLDSAEIQSSSYLCNGAAGPSGLTARMLMTPELPGANCVNGGQRVSVGLDANANGVLDAAEIQSSSYICNGASGPTGPAGPTGPSGLTARMLVTPELAGANCSNGGQRISVGLDSNANGILDAAEIQSSSFVCNGTNGSAGPTGPTGPTGPAGPGAALFTSSGSYTVPAGIHAVLIEAWGGGGGGSNAFNCRPSVSLCAQVDEAYYGANNGGGGGAGAYQRVYLSVTPGSVLTVAAGSPGVASIPGVRVPVSYPPPASGDGGDSLVVYQGLTVLTARGGKAGSPHIYSSDNGDLIFATPGSGGTASFAAPALGLGSSAGAGGVGAQGAGAGAPGSGGNGLVLATKTQPTNGGSGMVIILPVQ